MRKAGEKFRYAAVLVHGDKAALENVKGQPVALWQDFCYSMGKEIV